ncbi:preprotein translocase subunit SecY [Marinitoga sp. 1135]|uniref:Protein translocase subunit SecY n=1 Tax=Marinitoga piezophila (strain DSM 14283 / JCM 11233 / KA3) TaxID=443254 RepID=H2J784_MARPK|nr:MULTISPECIES: preprotein translocase subunit SecY [Marinitoga]AEX85276.1 preprotein translocase, SecY subunit [Marinitoga piezophila KA3]APT75761.1 preprotein translocase subunit SecY [Marinitoga sp. 1137]NUU95503.1 preprotein translocase subunit SecY [Marinitoga sp. 1135]NUU97430.1 preprotein translocase subunit SecY [Marinitoga sp. 1138]
MKDAFKNMWKIPELRDRIIFTLLALIAFRVGIYIPIPGIDLARWESFLAGLGTSSQGLISFFDIFAGGALKQFSIFVLSVTPYINASIILQLLSSVIPSLKEMLKEGEEGRKKFGKLTRQVTLGLAILQGLFLSMGVSAYRAANLNYFVFLIVSTISIVAGTMFLLWLGEMITEKGIGNGISVLIFAGIVARYPQYIASGFVGRLSVFEWIVLIIIAIAVVIGTIYLQTSERRINVQYAKRVVGNKIYGGASTYIPIKVNGGGVLPIIFASAIMTLPSMLATATGAGWVSKWFGYGTPLYLVLYAILIFFFAYFYNSVVIDPNDISENIKKYGGFIPGIRPGKPTSDYITKTMMRVTFIGAVFLVIISLLPYLIRSAAGVNIWIGGTSALISVGVALDIMQQIEAHMITRQYEGFMKKGKLRGRR